MCPPLSYLSKVQLTVVQELLLDVSNCLIDVSKSGKWISYNFLHLMDMNMSQSWCIHQATWEAPYVFCSGLKSSLADRLLPLLRLKSFCKGLSLPEALFSNFIVNEEPILLTRCFNKSAMFGQFCNTSTVLATPNPLVQLNTLMIISTQLAQFVETLQLSWPKTLLFILTGFKSTTFGTYKL